MADTQRRLAAIVALLANNTDGDISPQDHRDTVETMRNGHGEISVTATSSTTIATSNSFVVVAGTYTLSGNASNWDMNSNGQLRYIGAASRVAHIASSLSFSTVGNSKVIEIAVAKNGTVVAPSTVSRKTGTGGDVGSTAVHAFIDVDTNDYLDVRVANTTDDTNLTVEKLNLFAMDMVH